MRINKNSVILPVIALQATAMAGVRWEPEQDLNDGEGMPDWAAFIILIFVVLMLLGKFK